MDQLSYDLGELTARWKGELHRMPDTTEELRAQRRVLQSCIIELNTILERHMKED